MIDQLKKLYYGYSVATNKDYVAIGSPSIFLSGSIYTPTGSIEILQYNTETDSYDHRFTIKKQIDPNSIIDLLSTEASDELHTNSSSLLNDLGIMLETSNTIINRLDSYGVSVCLSGSILAVGNPYNVFSITYSSSLINASGVDIYDLSTYDESTNYYPIQVISNSFDVGYSGSSFGESVSMYGMNLTVGSSKSNSIYAYSQSAINNWKNIQTITKVGSSIGKSLKIDPSGSNMLVIGNNSSVNGVPVYVYQFDSSTTSWIPFSELYENRSLTGSLKFINYPPYQVDTVSSGSKFGNSVSIYGSNIVVGAPDDMFYLEYSGSSILKNRGSVYFYKRCTDTDGWEFNNKSFGSELCIDNNNLGYAVDIYENKSIVTLTKTNNPFSSSYIINTLYKKFNCNPNDHIVDTSGQFLVYSLNKSGSWDIESTINKKKKYGYPYTVFGYSCALYDNICMIGSPLLLQEYVNITSSSESTIEGYAYLYDFNNYVTDHTVGNVFYKNGKIILSNSGSIFDNLLKDRSNLENPKYDITYKSKITLYEKQVVCTVNPGEFNFSTNQTALEPSVFDFDIDVNNIFDFKDLDLILKYINYRIYGTYDWENTIEFTDVEQSLFDYYSVKYDRISNYVSGHLDTLTSAYSKFDIDGNGKININDMIILWKYFVNDLKQSTLFKYVEPKSTRKEVQLITSYLEEKTGKNGNNIIKKEFFNFENNSYLDRTGSYLAPYVTGIGLYNKSDLVGYAKLGMPIKNEGKLPLNFIIRLDI